MKKFVKNILVGLGIAGVVASATYGCTMKLLDRGQEFVEAVDESPLFGAKNIDFSLGDKIVEAVTATAPVVINVDSIICRESLIDVAELSVIEEHSRNVYVYDKPNDRTGFLNIELFGTHATYAFTYEGYVNAGIGDLEACRFDVDQEAQIITVTLPEVEILHCDVDETSIEEVLYDTGVFADLDPEDMSDMLSVCNSELRASAESSDILERAHDRVEALMRRSVSDMISGTALEKYTVEIVFTEDF